MNWFTRLVPIVIVGLCMAVAASADTLELKDGRVLTGHYLGGTKVILHFEVNGEVETFNVTQVVALSFGENYAPPPAAQPAPQPQMALSATQPQVTALPAQSVPPQQQAPPQVPPDQQQSPQNTQPPPVSDVNTAPPPDTSNAVPPPTQQQPADANVASQQAAPSPLAIPPPRVEPRTDQTPAQQPETSANTPPAEEPASTGAPPPPPQTASGPASGAITVPAGQTLLIRMIDSVDSSRNQIGDPFHATLETDLVLNNMVIAHKGTDVHGRLARVRAAGSVSGTPELQLQLTQITIDGHDYPLVSSDYDLVGKNRGKGTAEKIGGGAVMGAIIGAIAGGGRGAAIGAGAGTVVGSGVAVMTRGKAVKVPSETLLEFRLQQPLTVVPTEA